MSELPLMMSVRESAKQTGLSYQYLLQLCKTGKVACVKSGNRYLVNTRKLAQFLNDGEKPDEHVFEA